MRYVLPTFPSRDATKTQSDGGVLINVQKIGLNILKIGNITIILRFARCVFSRSKQPLWREGCIERETG